MKRLFIISFFIVIFVLAHRVISNNIGTYKYPNTKFISASTAVPQIRLENYELFDDKISVEIEILNVLTKDIKHLFLALECSTVNGNSMDIYLLIMSENDTSWANNIKQSYDIRHIQFIEASIPVNERREIDFEINVSNASRLKSCSNFYVRGYTTSS